MGKLLACLVVLGIHSWSSTARAQQDRVQGTGPAPESVAGARQYAVVTAQLEPSYLTILGGEGNIQPLLFEADIAPHFVLAWRNHGFVFTPKVLFRMFNDSTDSAPIRTPSFMPRLTWYYWGFRPSADRDRLDFISVTLSHHSNGQAGPFYFSDTSEPNTLDGSFSTNFIEVTHHRAYGAAPALQATWLRYGLRVHIPFNEDRELRDPEGDDEYGRYRLLLGGQRRGILPIFPSFELPFIVRAEYFYILDKHFQGKPFFSSGRLGLSLTWISVIPAAESLGFFVNFYAGQDYYNIWYKQYLTILRVGFTAQSITTLLNPR